MAETRGIIATMDAMNLIGTSVDTDHLPMEIVAVGVDVDTSTLHSLFC